MIGVAAVEELLERPLRDGDAYQWKVVVEFLLRDEPMLEMVRRDCAGDIADLGFPPELIRTFVFDRAYLLAVAHRQSAKIAGEFIYDPEDSVWPNAGAVVAIGQRPVGEHACSATLPPPARRPCPWCGRG